MVAGPRARAGGLRLGRRPVRHTGGEIVKLRAATKQPQGARPADSAGMPPPTWHPTDARPGSATEGSLATLLLS